MFIRGELIETCSVDALLITVNSETCLKYTLKHTVSKFLRARIGCSPSIRLSRASSYQVSAILLSNVPKG